MIRYIVLGMLLSSCVPTIIEQDDISLTYIQHTDYTVMQIDSKNTLYNVSLNLRGTDLTFNDPKCNIVGNLVKCTYQSLKSYQLPFRGIINSVEMNYMDASGKGRTFTRP